MPRPPRAAGSSSRPIARHGEGRVRIVGGRWRNTRLVVPDLPGLRPTGERVRETLFNWLQPRLAGARVLDLFAGSGALGLEAVSRGAASALLVERDPALAAQLRAQVERLGAGRQVQVEQADALRWLAQTDARFDIAFVDPPFADALWLPVLSALPARLAAEAWLYLESPRQTLGQAQMMPASDWRLYRQGHAGEVGYALYQRATATLRSDQNQNPDA